QTLVHLDFWPMNLFVDDDTVTAIDWSQIGVASLAQDLDQIALDAVWMQIRPASDLPPLEDVVMSAYLRGLDDGGLDVEAADVWRWYAAAAALKYAWMVGGQAATVARPDGVRSQ